MDCARQGEMRSQVEVIEDSEPEREEKAEKPVRQRSRVDWSAASSAEAGSSRFIGSSAVEAPDAGLGDEDSDIEIVPAHLVPARSNRSDAGSKAKTKKRRSDGSSTGGFTSASAMLKLEAKKDKGKGKQRDPVQLSAKQEVCELSQMQDSGCTSMSGDAPVYERVHEVEYDDDEIIELPPPLSRSPRPTAMSIESEAPPSGQSCSTKPISVAFDPVDSHSPLKSDLSLIGSDTNSPSTLFKSSIAKFRAGGNSNATSSRKSKTLFSSDVSRARSVSVKPSLSYDTPSQSDSSSSGSTSIKPLAGKASSSSVPPSLSTSVSTLPTDLVDIPTPYLALLSACPVCESRWTAYKAPSIKQNHIRKCAAARGYLSSTVSTLAEREIMKLRDDAEARRRVLESEKTLFESTVSRKGKEVLVVGVEQKQSKSKLSTGSDIENQDLTRNNGSHARAQAVLLTQGGSAHSQATSTQVQREINGQIKVNQKLAKGDYSVAAGVATKSVIGVLKPSNGARGAMAGSAGASASGKASDMGKNSTAVGSKNWQKAMDLLAKSEKVTKPSDCGQSSAGTASESDAGAPSLDIDLEKDAARSKRVRREQQGTGKLQAYSDSRFRLAEKAMRIADLRLVRSPGASAAVAAAEVSVDAAEARAGHAPFARPYRRTDGRSRSLIDQAHSIARDLPYDLWHLAGSVVDAVPDRIVSSPSYSSASISPPPPLTLSPSSSPTFARTIDGPLGHSSSPTRSRLYDLFLTAGATATPTSSPVSARFSTLSLSYPDSSSAPSSILAREGAPPSPTSSATQQARSPTHPAPPVSSRVSSGPTASASEASQRLSDLTARMRGTKISSALERAREDRARKSRDLQLLKARGCQAMHTAALAFSPGASGQDGVGASLAESADDSAEVEYIAAGASQEGGKKVQSALEDASPAKKRGRPPGSKNKAKPPDLDIKDKDEVESGSTSEEIPLVRVKSSKAALTSIAQTSPKRKKKDHSSTTSGSDDELGPLDQALQIDKPKRKSRKSDAGETAGASSSKTSSSASKGVQPALTSALRTIKKATPKASAERKKKATASTDPPTFDRTKYSLPDYDSWDKERLQKETGRYGYKPSGTKKVLVAQLERVWRALNLEEAQKMDRERAAADAASRTENEPLDDIEDSEDEIDIAPAKKTARAPWKAKPKAKPSSSSAESEAEAAPKKGASKSTAAKKATKTGVSPLKLARVDLTQLESESDSAAAVKSPRKQSAATAATAAAAARKRAAAKKKADSEAEVDTDAEAEELKTASDKLRDEVLKDKAFYMRILRYEPICFTDFEAIATKAKVKISKVALRDWLDSQAIIFYYPQEIGRNADRTKKPRNRHP